MFGWFRPQPVTLPADAHLALTADSVHVWSRTAIPVGQVACDELRVGDEVVAVGDAPLGRWTVAGLEQFQRTLSSATRGEPVAVFLGPRAPAALPPGVRLFRIPVATQRPNQALQQTPTHDSLLGWLRSLVRRCC